MGGFSMTGARSDTTRTVVALLAIILGGADAASAASVTLPGDAVIASPGDTTVVNVDMGSVTNLEAAAINITFNPTIDSACVS
jgi:hypothetical protein